MKRTMGFSYGILKEWCLDCKGWQLEGSKKSYDISEIEDTPENRNKIFYKQMLIEGYDEERDIAKQNMMAFMPYVQTLMMILLI